MELQSSAATLVCGAADRSLTPFVAAADARRVSKTFAVVKKAYTRQGKNERGCKKTDLHWTHFAAAALVSAAAAQADTFPRPAVQLLCGAADR
eukprot:1396139-Rhodomonas_salina.1